MATHLVIIHEISLPSPGGPREQSALLAKMEAELGAMEKKVVELHGTTVVEAPTRKGPREKAAAAPAAPSPETETTASTATDIARGRHRPAVAAE